MQWQGQPVWVRLLEEVNGEVNDEAVRGLSDLYTRKTPCPAQPRC